MSEIMLEFNSVTREPLRDVQLFEKHVTAIAALVVSVRGDYENISNMEALQTFLGYEHGKTEYLR